MHNINRMKKIIYILLFIFLILQVNVFANNQSSALAEIDKILAEKNTSIVAWKDIEDSENFKKSDKNGRIKILTDWVVKSDNILKSLNDYKPEHSIELGKYAQSILNKINSEPQKSCSIYSEKFKAAVHQDIIRRMDEDKNFELEVDNLCQALGEDKTRNIAYEEYAKKPEFKKYLVSQKSYSMYSENFIKEVHADLRKRIDNADARTINIINAMSAEERETFKQDLYSEYAQKPEFKKYLEPEQSFVAQNIILLIFTISLIVLGVKIIIKNFPNAFSLKGRESRKTYWIWWLCMFSFFIIFSIFFSFLGSIISLTKECGLTPYFWLYPLWIVFILFYIPYVCVQIRRMHDMNISGYWYILFLSINHTPLVIIKWIILGCIRGTRGTNKYGEPVVVIDKSQAKNQTEELKTEIESQKNNKNTNMKIVISFFLGLLLGILITYAMSNKYVSYASKNYNIVRVNKWTGKTEISNSNSSYPTWKEVK